MLEHFARVFSEPGKAAVKFIDLADQTHRQTIVDREAGQYLGHPTTVLLEDGQTILCVYPKGHGKGAILFKRSADGGLTWSERLPTPASWATSLETPTIHRLVDASGKKRLILWSGLYPARRALSEDDGASWTELEAAGDWGGIVVMSSVAALRTGAGHYMALFHDDGRYFTRAGQDAAGQIAAGIFTLYQTISRDGGLTWATPCPLLSPQQANICQEIDLCEPGLIRSPDGKQLAVLLRENSRQKNSHIIFSDDEGQHWSDPRELPAVLSGDRHVGQYAPDGRLFISFRDTAFDSPTYGDWAAWVGRYEDLLHGDLGQYRLRLMDNLYQGDCAYPGVEVLPDGVFVVTTYGHWQEDQPPYIVSIRLKLAELDQIS